MNAPYNRLIIGAIIITMFVLSNPWAMSHGSYYVATASIAGEDIRSFGPFPGGEGSLYGNSTVAGDFNNDGVSDIAVAAPGSGKVYIFFGPLDASNMGAGSADATLSGDARFGTSLGSLDFNNDGNDDLAVSQPSYNGTGAVFVYFGPISGDMGTGDADYVCEGGQAGAQFGASIAALGDFDSIAGDDIMVGAPGWDGGITDSGAVFVLSGGETGHHTSADSTIYFLGINAGEMVGQMVYSLGDINGDGLGDGGFLRATGKVDVMYGRQASRSSHSRISATASPSGAVAAGPKSSTVITPVHKDDPYEGATGTAVEDTPLTRTTRGHQGTTDLTGSGWASASSYKSSNPPSRAIDDDTSSYWLSNNELSSSAYLRIDLGGIYKVNIVKIYTPHPKYDSPLYEDYLTGNRLHIKDADIQGSVDSSTWVTLATIRNNNFHGWVERTFTPTDVRYLKITNIHWNSVTYYDPFLDTYITLSDSSVYKALAEVEAYAWENYEPTNGGVSISSTEIYARQDVVDVTVSYEDQDGATDIDYVEVFINSDDTVIDDTARGFLHARYERSTNRFSIYDGNDSAIADSCYVGDRDLENDYVVLKCTTGGSYATTNGNTLTVHWVFVPKFTWGNEMCYVYRSVMDVEGAFTPMETSGQSLNIYADVEIDDPSKIVIYSPVLGELSNSTWLSPSTPVYVEDGGARVVYKSTNLAVDDKYYNVAVEAGSSVWKDTSTADGDGTFNLTIYGQPDNDPTGTDYVLKITDLDGITAGESYTLGTFKTDAAPPTVSITDVTDPDWDDVGTENDTQGNWYSQNRISQGIWINISVSDAESGFGAARLIWDAEGNGSDMTMTLEGMNNYISPAPTEGHVNITILAYDLAGNEANLTMALNIDGTPPSAPVNVTIQPQEGVEGEMDDDGIVYVKWDAASDSGSGVGGYLIGVNTPDVDTFVADNHTELELSPGMVNTVYVAAVDHTGNMGPIAYDTIYVNFKPELTLSGLPDEPVLKGIGDINGDGYDDILIYSGSGSGDVVVLFGGIMDGEVNIQVAGTLTFTGGTTFLTFGIFADAISLGNSKMFVIGSADGETRCNVYVVGAGSIMPGTTIPPDDITVYTALNGTPGRSSALIIPAPEGDLTRHIIIGEPDVNGGSLEAVRYTTNPDINNQPPAVTLISPNGGEKWTGTRDITWMAYDADGDTMSFTVLLSMDGGKTYNITIATGLEGSTRSYSFDTSPYPNGTGYRIKVVADDGRMFNNIGSDESAANFTIYHPATGDNQLPVVSVVYPNGGEVLDGIVDIVWTASDPDGDTLSFSVYLSADGGATWPYLIGNTNNSVQDLEFDTSSYPNGSLYLIKVVADDGHEDGVAWDISNSVFEIAHSGEGGTNRRPTVTLVKPVGGEVFSQTVDIVWTASDPDGDTLKVSIYYRDFNSAWMEIATDLPNTGSYIWDVRGMPEKNTYRIKVEATDGKLSAWDSSPYVFSIISNREPSAVIRSPEEGSSWYTGDLINFSALGSSDPDGDSLIYTWTVNGTALYSGSKSNFTYSFDKPGEYTITLTVSDGHGGNASRMVTITVFERPPGKVTVEGLEVTPQPNGTTFNISFDVVCTGGEASNITVLLTAEYTDTTTVTIGRYTIDHLSDGDRRTYSVSWTANRSGSVAIKASVVDDKINNDMISDYYDVTIPDNNSEEVENIEKGISMAIVGISLVVIIIAVLAVLFIIRKQREDVEFEEEPTEDAVPGIVRSADLDSIDMLLEGPEMGSGKKGNKGGGKERGKRSGGKKGKKGKKGGKKGGGNKKKSSPPTGGIQAGLPPPVSPAESTEFDLDSIDLDLDNWGESLGEDKK